MESLTFHASVKGEYIPIPLNTQDLEAAKAIRKEFSSTDPDIISDVVAVLDGAKRLTKDASSTTKRCLETSASHRSACFTAMDLVTFRAFQPEGTKSATKDAISHLRQKFRNLAASDTKLLATYSAAFDAISTQKRAVAAYDFIGRLKTCTTERNAHTYCSDTYMNDSKKFIDAYLDVDTFLANKNRLRKFSSKNSKPIPAFELRAKWQDVALKVGKDADSKLDESWASLVRRGDRFVSTNLAESADSQSAIYATVKLEAKKASSADAKEAFESFAILSSTAPRERTYILRSPRVGAKQFGFSKGDSGSLFSLGVVPVAVLSHVDGKETSGGAAVIPLPSRKTKEVASSPTRPQRAPETASAPEVTNPNPTTPSEKKTTGETKPETSAPNSAEPSGKETSSRREYSERAPSTEVESAPERSDASLPSDVIQQRSGGARAPESAAHSAGEPDVNECG
jgi:hypothetical protein